MDLFEITSFAEIIKSIKFSNESNFSENSHIIYQCFYDLLNKIDFQNMNTCIFGETDGFILTTITQRAKSVVVFPLESSSLIFTNLSQFKTLHNLKKFNLFARDINEKNEKAYQQICYIKKKPILFNECAILIISRNDQDYDKILNNIGKTILFEGVLIILSLEGKSETIVNKIKEETFLQSVQKYTLCPSSSVSVDIIIMSIKKSESPMQIPDDINILYENFKNSNQKKESSSQHTENNFLLSKYLSEIKMTKSDQNKAPKKYYIINGYFIYFFKDTKNKFNQPLKETDAQSYLFIPLYKYELTKSKKSIKVSQKESIINNLTIKQYKSLYENNDNDLFDTDCIYEFTPTDSNLFYELNTRSRAFLEETAKISSFSDLNFDAQLYTLPDYKTIKDPIDIPVSVRITSDGIFIYSSSPFYHVVFADYWDMNSYATPFPYVKCNMKSKDYRKTIALILTKGSRQSVQDDNDNNSEEIEIENELDFLFNCEKPEQQDTNEESNDDDNDNDDENEAQIEKEEQQNKKDKGKEKDKKDKGKDKDKGKGKVKDKQKDKEKDKEKEKDKGKDKDKDKGKDKDKDKGKDKNDQPKEKPEKSTEKDKNDQKKVKNEKPTNTDQDVDVNTKIKQFFQFNKQDNQNTICDKTLGCVSLKFANSKMMMNFVISVNQAISYSLSVSIKKRIEEMIIKMNNEKKSDEPKKKEGGNNDDDTNTIDY